MRPSPNPLSPTRGPTLRSAEAEQSPTTGCSRWTLTAMFKIAAARTPPRSPERRPPRQPAHRAAQGDQKKAAAQRDEEAGTQAPARGEDRGRNASIQLAPRKQQVEQKPAAGYAPQRSHRTTPAAGKTASPRAARRPGATTICPAGATGGRLSSALRVAPRRAAAGGGGRAIARGAAERRRGYGPREPSKFARRGGAARVRRPAAPHRSRQVVSRQSTGFPQGPAGRRRRQTSRRPLLPGKIKAPRLVGRPFFRGPLLSRRRLVLESRFRPTSKEQRFL